MQHPLLNLENPVGIMIDSVFLERDIETGEVSPVEKRNEPLMRRHSSPLFSRQTGMKIGRLRLGLNGPGATQERNRPKLLFDMFHSSPLHIGRSSVWR